VDAEPERTATILRFWEELERRGHNVEGYVRWGFDRFIATAIVISTLLPDLEAFREVEDHEEPSQIVREAPPGWVDLLDETGASTPELDEAFASLPEQERASVSRVVGALSGPFSTLVRAWVKVASRDDLLAWRPPDDPEEVRTLAAIETSTKTKEDRAIYRWLVDRFTITYLGDWAKSSLYREWRYLHAELTAPCSNAEMRERKIAEGDISKAIANRVALAPEAKQEDDSRQKATLSVGQLEKAAIGFLESGRRTAAAALFEAAKLENPLNADVRNNYGFCILPDHPKDGLQEIHAASELGYYRPDITLANRMYGLFLLGRYTSALEAAERLFQQEDRRDQAYLWDWRKEAENTSVILINPHQYAAQFALEIAEMTRDLHAADVWNSRVESLESRRSD
jgi:hypothetical protein